MSELERIVRPSQDGSIRPAPVLGYRAPPETPDNNTITWGSAGSSIFQISASTSITLPGAEWPKSDEISRTYDVVRVKNEDDPDQHIDVEVMTKYQARNQIDKKRVEYNYAKMNPTEGNIEIISSGNVRKSST